MNVVNNARKDLDAEIARKRKEMRAAHKTVIVAEDEPSVYKQELHKRAVKVISNSFVTKCYLDLAKLAYESNEIGAPSKHRPKINIFSSCLLILNGFESK